MKETKKQDRKTGNKSPKMLLIVAAATIITFLLIANVSGPQRSANAFCERLAEEKTRLSEFPGDTYPSGVFKEELSDASEFAKSFAAIEEVAPEEIQPDLKTLKKTYQSIHDDPTKAISAALSAYSAEESVLRWVDENCTEQTED